MLSVRGKPKYMTVRQPVAPEKVWTRCEGCGRIVFKGELEKTAHLCPACGYHFRIGAAQRLALLADEGSFAPFPPLVAANPLGFPEYEQKISQAQEQTGLDDAALVGRAAIQGHDCILAVIDFSFLGGSMGSVVGEQLVRGFDAAVSQQLPVVVVSGGGGGARMQEGIFSLMQMAKTAQAVGRHSRAGLLFVSILTHPTMGGVYASFSSLGDIIIAEPGALIGFAGPRIVEEATRQKLPSGFQTAEFALKHGMIDAIVPRPELSGYVGRLLAWHR